MSVGVTTGRGKFSHFFSIKLENNEFQWLRWMFTNKFEGIESDNVQPLIHRCSSGTRSKWLILN